MLAKTLLTFTLLALSSGLAQAQWSGLPQCGASCAQLSSSKATGCTSSDLKCLCQSQDYENAVYDCLATACDFGDQSSTIGNMQDICAAAVSAPDTSTAAAPASSTTAGASSSAATSSSAAGAPAASSTTTAAAAFTRAPGATTSSTVAAGTGSVTRALGTTTVATSAGAGTTAGASTTVVVKTVSDGAEATASGGSNILNGNGALGMGVGGGMGMGMTALAVGAVMWVGL